MTKLDWGLLEDRTYEGGVDHGVLYVDGVGHAWPGLTAVRDTPSGADHKAYYIDGIKYAERRGLEEFEATIEAFTYPDAFARCDGTAEIGNGLFVTQQRRRQFGFSYRTKVGNAIEGRDFAYKIHVVYNALAEPSSRNYQTFGDQGDPSLFTWKITTKPPVLDFVPTAHYVIDSRSTPSDLLEQIEDILYGTDGQDPRQPSAGELAFLFKNFASTVYDSGGPTTVSYFTFDGGSPTPSQIDITLDGGSP